MTRYDAEIGAWRRHKTVEVAQKRTRIPEYSSHAVTQNTYLIVMMGLIISLDMVILELSVSQKAARVASEDFIFGYRQRQEYLETIKRNRKK